MPTSHRLPQEQVTPDADIRGKEASQIKVFFLKNTSQIKDRAEQSSHILSRLVQLAGSWWLVLN
jgi:hypothetical protein